MQTPKSPMAQQIARAASAFQEQRTGHVPQSVAVVLSDDALVITLHEMKTNKLSENTDFNDSLPRMWAMNWDEIAGTWRQFRGKVRERVGNLVGSDRMTIAGKRDQFAGLLQQEYGSAKAQSNKQFGPGAPVLIPVTNPTLPRDTPGGRR